MRNQRLMLRVVISSVKALRGVACWLARKRKGAAEAAEAAGPVAPECSYNKKIGPPATAVLELPDPMQARVPHRMTAGQPPAGTRIDTGFAAPSR